MNESNRWIHPSSTIYYFQESTSEYEDKHLASIHIELSFRTTIAVVLCEGYKPSIDPANNFLCTESIKFQIHTSLNLLLEQDNSLLRFVLLLATTTNDQSFIAQATIQVLSWMTTVSEMRVHYFFCCAIVAPGAFTTSQFYIHRSRI